MSGLQPTHPEHEYCVICSAQAAGPCASCGAPVCGNCSELVSGAVGTFAVCKRCSGERSLWRAWAALLLPIAALVALAGLVVLILLAR